MKLTATPLLFIMTRLLVALVLPIAVTGCETSRDCEKARLKAHRAYQTLNEVAIQRKLAGVDSEKWMVVENRTDTLRSSFATAQVTWKSAEKARKEVTVDMGSITTDNPINLEIFKRSAEEAFKLQDLVAKQCH
jgi:hypothetical protein